MRWRVLIAVGIVAASGAGCARSPAGRAGDAGPRASIEAGARREARAGDRRSEAVFSAPIAAARAKGAEVVAGLVAAKGVVRVVGWPDGGPAWTRDALRGVEWTPDSDLRIEPAGDGVAVAWRGNVDGKPGRQLVVLGPGGEPQGDAIAIGASFCATADGLAWLDPSAKGAARVRARRWADAAASDVAAVPSDRAASLLCGDRDVFVLGDGDDDVTASSFAPGSAAPPPVVILRDADFGDDDEREHHAYTYGDGLGLVRVGGSGAVAVRELTRAGASPWRRLEHRIPPDDDIVAVDGDAASTFVVFTHDEAGACDAGATAERVRALRVDRATGQDAVVDLAPPDCRGSRGPFWIADRPSGSIVAWIERAAKGAAAGAPIDALVFVSAGGGDARPGRAEVRADALAPGDCRARCVAAALERPSGEDGSRPEAVALIDYP